MPYGDRYKWSAFLPDEPVVQRLKGADKEGQYVCSYSDRQRTIQAHGQDAAEQGGEPVPIVGEDIYDPSANINRLRILIR